MQRYGQQTSKIPQKWVFSPICDPPKIFFKNRALSLLYPYGALTLCKTLEKNQCTASEIFKDGRTTDRPRTDGQGRLLRTPSGEPRVQKMNRVSNKFCFKWKMPTPYYISSSANSPSYLKESLIPNLVTFW